MAEVESARGARSGEVAQAEHRRPQSAREAILEAAARNIARQGIQGLRVEQVAEDAGVSTALLYYHFESRAGLVAAAFEYASEQAPSTALRLEDDTRSGYEAVRQSLLAELDEDPAVRDYSIVWGDVSASAVFEAELRPLLRSITGSWRDAVAGAIERGIRDGSIRADLDVDATAELLIVLVDGFCMRWLSGSLELERARALLEKAIAALLEP
jgi:AcrR family transcriptional regulator